MRKQIQKNIDDLNELIEDLQSRWEMSTEFNLLDINLVNKALKDAIKTRDGLQAILDLLNE